MGPAFFWNPPTPAGLLLLCDAAACYWCYVTGDALWSNFKACIRRWPLLPCGHTPFITAVTFWDAFSQAFYFWSCLSGGAINHTAVYFFEAFRSHTELTTLAHWVLLLCTYVHVLTKLLGLKIALGNARGHALLVYSSM